MKVITEWEASRINIFTEGEEFILLEPLSDENRWKHGSSMKGVIELTLQQAIQLRESLDASILVYEETDKSVDEYFNTQDRAKGLPPMDLGL